MIDLGIVKPGATVNIPFGSYTGSTGASSAASNYAAADILVYKNGSDTQRASSNGLTATTTFDSVTGINLCSINLADNSTAGFWEAGADYFVIVGPITVDSQTVNFPIAHFTIGMPGAVLNTTIATLSTQTSFTLTNGPAEDDALNGCVVYIHDVASAVQGGFAVVSDYTGASKTVTLVAGTTFTAAATDNISVFPPVSVAQFGGVNLTQSGGRPEVNTTHAAGTAWGSGAITAASIAADAITSAKIATGAIDADAIADNAIDAGAIATGAITAAKFAAGAIDAAAIAADAITAAKIATGAIDADAIAADAITAAKIATGAIDADAIADGAIDAGAIAAGALTAAKFAAGAIDAAALAADAGAEIAAAVWAATLTELSADPGASPAASGALLLPYMAIRNKRDTTASTDEIHNSAGTVLLTAAVSDDGTTFTKAKYA